MHRVTRRAESIVVQHEPAARILLDEFARREMVLEVDDHRGRVLLNLCRHPEVIANGSGPKWPAR